MVGRNGELGRVWSEFGHSKNFGVSDSVDEIATTEIDSTISRMKHNIVRNIMRQYLAYAL
jgi:hypothetical protein